MPLVRLCYVVIMFIMLLGLAEVLFRLVSWVLLLRCFIAYVACGFGSRFLVAFADFG